MTKLSVNINKIATLRNARGENKPNLVAMAMLIESLGADGITVHPRPDERHIKRRDVFELKKALRTEFNVEGYPSADFISLMQEIRPEQITLVPDPPHVLTSNAGFNFIDDALLVSKAVSQLKNTGSRISLFIDPKDFYQKSLAPIKDSGCDRIELYTYRYAENPNDPQILKEYQSVAEAALKLGIGLNAGHDLSLDNLAFFLEAIPSIEEVSIGHALISDALVLGMAETMKRYLSIVHAG